MKMILGKWVSQAVAVAAETRIADHLAEGPLAVETLAQRVGVNEDALYRLLRALAGLGIFSETTPRTFGLTPLSQLLRSDTSGSLRAFAQWLGHEPSWLAWSKLGAAVRTGRPGFDQVFGMPIFEYAAHHPESVAVFNAAMEGPSQAHARAILRAYDFSSMRLVADIGGGGGVLLSTILADYPSLRGILFDLPAVVTQARPLLAASEQADRLEIRAGNFFEQVPAGADAYMMKHVLHDWDDAHCVRLLENCRRAMAPGGRILVLEKVISDRPESLFGKLADLEMLVMTPGGRERTQAEFVSLFEQAGLRLERLVPTESPLSVLEVRSAA